MTTPEPPQTKPRRGPQRLATLVPGEVAPVFAKRGFAGADLAVHWPEIVGAGVAKYSRPLAMTWPKGGAEQGLGASLTVACSGGFALDLQQMAPVLVERINRRLGWRCVTRILIRQMPVRPVTPGRGAAPPAPEDVNAASRIAAGIRHDRLRDAMTRLGAGALARERRRKSTAPSQPPKAPELP